MKRILIAAILLVSVVVANAQVKFDALQFNPQMPKAGQTVSFKFNSKLSPLIAEKKIDIAVYIFTINKLKVLEPKILQTGTVYTGSFKLDSNTVCIALGFSANDGKEKDNNAGNGYIIPVYGKNNLPILDYYTRAGSLYNGYGEFLFGMKNDAEKNVATLEEGLKLHPGAMEDKNFFSAYLFAINSAKKKEGGELAIFSILKKLANKPDVTEADFTTLTQWYNRLKMRSVSDSFLTIFRKKYPDGAWRKSEMENAIDKAKDADSKKAAFEAYIKAFPPKEDDKRNINFYKGGIARTYQKEKNEQAFKTWANELPMPERASLYNDLSWKMAEEKINVAAAKLMSFEATDWAKKQILAPTEKKPDNVTKKQWAENRKNTYGMYADTYAFILYNSGEYKTGLQYAKEAAGDVNGFKNAEYNERYCDLLVKVAPAATAKKEIEQFVKDGVASSKSKALLKDIYVAEKGSGTGYDDYITQLEATAKEKKRADLANTMISEEAPKFSLKDLDGNEVSLAGLKGKVVVVDFWATWCGPCIASMPAMKTALEQLKQRDDVVFVFVDTWESAENKKQNAADFMTKNKYPFHVLLDEADKVVADFKVNGIPTKFVIDKTGNIRFKSIGFDGNDAALVDEVNMMVEMASADMPAKNYVK